MYNQRTVSLSEPYLIFVEGVEMGELEITWVDERGVAVQGSQVNSDIDIKIEGLIIKEGLTVHKLQIFIHTSVA